MFMFAELDQIHQNVSTCGQASTHFPSFENGKKETSLVAHPGHIRNAFPSTLPQPPSTTKTSARPPPACPASARERPSCAPRRACPGVGVPVGTQSFPRLGGGDLLPGSMEREGVET